MSKLLIEDQDVTRLIDLAAIIIPRTAEMPSAKDLVQFGRYLRAAIAACGYEDEEIRAALGAIGPQIDWAGAMALAANFHEQFRIASTLISAAYYMDPVILAKLGYPVDRQHPAALEEFADEYETGILDAVTERGPRFRDTRQHVAETRKE